MTWISRAPSNIALIKYMGKKDRNIPINVSLSYTLNKFFTEVRLESCLKEDRFSFDSTTNSNSNSNSDSVFDFALNQKSICRFLQHLQYIKQLFGYNGYFSIKSWNNFPHSAGIASSSSSFAALTKCATTAICSIKGLSIPTAEEMSKISREASGASCRSFFSPWSVWKEDGAQKIDLKIGELDHDLILIDKKPKTISSSEAHKLVKSSPFFAERAERAEQRFHELVDCLNNCCRQRHQKEHQQRQDQQEHQSSDEQLQWNRACQICWDEFQDMHRLFETSIPSFRYIQTETTEILNKIQQFYESNNDGPITTIDAGPNIHLLWKKSQKELRNQLIQMMSQFIY